MEKSNRVRTNFSKADLTGFRKPVRSIVRLLTDLSIRISTMTPSLKLTGFFATLVIIIILPLYTWREPGQQTTLLRDLQTDAVVKATDLYAENCVVCHGAAGEGIGTTPPLNTDAIREMAENDLFKTIARGRANTLMAAWATDEGGILTN